MSQIENSRRASLQAVHFRDLKIRILNLFRISKFELRISTGKHDHFVIFAATNGYLDEVPVPECRRYEKELYSFLEARHPSLLKGIVEKKDIKGELTDRIKATLAEFGTVFQGGARAS